MDSFGAHFLSKAHLLKHHLAFKYYLDVKTHEFYLTFPITQDLTQFLQYIKLWKTLNVLLHRAASHHIFSY